MILQAFPSGPFETNAYIVACPFTKEAAIVDPAPNSAAAILSFIEQQQLKPIKIILTHSHWDHIAEVAALKDQLPVAVWIHEADLPNLQHPGADGLPCWIPLKGVTPDGFLKEGDPVSIGRLTFTVIHTPGHSPGSICLYEPQQHILLSGDTLFKGTIGNLSFPTSVPDAMWSSLQKLEKLPPETHVYPGHGPSTTMGQETWLPQAKQLFNESF